MTTLMTTNMFMIMMIPIFTYTYYHTYDSRPMLIMLTLVPPILLMLMNSPSHLYGPSADQDSGAAWL